MKRISAMLTAGIALLIIAALSSCGSLKKATRKSKSDSISTEVKESFTQSNESETKAFGDSLNGSGFIQDKRGNDAKGDSLEAESKGLKIKIRVKPVLDSSGRKVGHRVEYEAVAKPTTIKTSKASAQKTASTTKTKVHKQEADEVKEKTSYGWIKWLVILICLLGLIRFRSKLRKLILNGK